jgi:hypothetical protein
MNIITGIGMVPQFHAEAPVASWIVVEYANPTGTAKETVIGVKGCRCQQQQTRHLVPKIK